MCCMSTKGNEFMYATKLMKICMYTMYVLTQTNKIHSKTITLNPA